MTRFIFVLLIFTISSAKAESIKYLCNGESNQIFITFDSKKKTVMIGKSKINKYWSEANYIFWHSANDFTVYEYTFKNSYNKLSGILKVKSHQLVTSKNNWYNYECSISE